MLTELNNNQISWNLVSGELESDGTFKITFVFKSDKFQPTSCVIDVIKCYEDGIAFDDITLIWNPACSVAPYTENLPVGDTLESHTFTIPAINIQSHNVFKLYGVQDSKEILLSKGVVKI